MNWIKALIFTLLAACTTTLRPTELQEYKQTSAMVSDKTQSRGGSGVIYKSGKESIVLTNKHVCNSLEAGGFVWIVVDFPQSTNKSYPIKAFKVSAQHDLCAVLVAANLSVNTTLSSGPPKEYDMAFVSGHPALFPNVTSQGYVVGDYEAELVLGYRECTEEEMKKDPIACMIEGYPVTIKYKANLVTALITGGSSGSAVFNRAGEIIGLVFAGYGGGLSYALVVPWENLNTFVTDEINALKWVAPKTKVEK